jgi:hypothetical protein
VGLVELKAPGAFNFHRLMLVFAVSRVAAILMTCIHGEVSTLAMHMPAPEGTQKMAPRAFYRHPNQFGTGLERFLRPDRREEQVQNGDDGRERPLSIAVSDGPTRPFNQ